jgi:hypothetical protein
MSKRGRVIGLGVGVDVDGPVAEIDLLVAFRGCVTARRPSIAGFVLLFLRLVSLKAVFENERAEIFVAPRDRRKENTGGRGCDSGEEKGGSAGFHEMDSL